MQPLLQTVLELSEQVQAAIEAGDWQRAQGLETERRAQLEQLVVEHATAGGLGATLTELAQSSRYMVGLVEHHKRRVLREAATVRTGHAGASVYEETGAAS